MFPPAVKLPSHRESDGNTSIPARRVRTPLISCHNGKRSRAFSLSETVTFLQVPSTDVRALHWEGTGSAGPVAGDRCVFTCAWGRCVSPCEGTGVCSPVRGAAGDTKSVLGNLACTSLGDSHCGKRELQERALWESKALDSRAQGELTRGERGLLCVRPGWTFAVSGQVFCSWAQNHP